MSLTLGQKLRQAREEQGIPVGEVADQTRIAPLYIESIDNDDYRALPGGIFNRGFVKSYAKYVGIDEQEALLDYAKLLNETEGNDVEEVKTYRPQVLTDDRMQSSMLPTLIIAAVILGLMTGAVLFLVNYLRQPAPPAAEASVANTNTTPAHTNMTVVSEAPASQPASNAPDIATSKIEFKAIGEIVSLTSTVDDVTGISNVLPGSTKLFEPKKSLKLSYSSSRAAFAQLTINGTSIVLPTAAPNPRRPIIEFEINHQNFGQIVTDGAVPGGVSSTSAASNSATAANANVPASNTRPGSTSERPAVNANTSRPTANLTRPVNRPTQR